jgi:hypothetical protein
MRTAAIPTTDNTLPSFLHPNLLEVQDELDLVWNVWNDLKNCKKQYLPKEQAEPEKAYKNRLDRAHFDNRFTPALKGHAGLLSEFTLTDEVPASIVLSEKDIDGQGNDLVTFFTEADELVMRDGGCGILVEYPPEDPEILTNRDLLESGRRPYLVLIDRRDILNWSTTHRGGKQFINRVVIRTIEEVDDGEFGTKQQTLYRVLRPGSFEVYELIHTKQGYVKRLVDEGKTSLSEVPIVWYSISESKLFQGQPPFMNLARLNIEHLQKRSSFNEIQYKINMPVPVRKGAKAIAPTVPGQPPIMPRLVIGPNSVVDVPETGDFSFAEPSGSGMALTQADIEKLERSMDRVTLAFLSGSETAKTATEVVLDTAQTQATLKGMATRKESCSQQIFRFWAAFTREPATGSLDVNESILQIPATPQEIQIILDAMGVQIPQALGLQMLLARRWLPADTKLEEIEQNVDLVGTQNTEPNDELP